MHSMLLAHKTNGPRMHRAFNAQPANGSGHMTVQLVLHAVTCSAATSAQLQDATQEKEPEVPEPQEEDSSCYTSANEHATNTQRVLRVCLALVQRTLHVSGVGAACSARVWRPSGEYIHVSSSAHIFVHAQISRCTERMTTNA